MEKIIVDNKLLAEFAKAIYRDVEEYLSTNDVALENTDIKNST